MPIRAATLGGAILLLLAPGAHAENPPAAPLPLPPAPPRIAEGADYDHCLSMLGTDPEGADAFADAWEATGGGDGATHCHALARITLGDPVTGAEMLEKLAAASTAPAAARAAIYGQAGQARMMARDPGSAYADTTLALTLSPDDPDLSIDRAIAAAGLDRYQQAIDDLDHALAADPDRPEALVYRAAAWRHLNQLDRAQQDTDRALALDPENPEALLERGILRQRQGNTTGARADWEHIIEIAPNTPTADLAQQNLALLDAGPQQGALPPAPPLRGVAP